MAALLPALLCALANATQTPATEHPALVEVRQFLQQRARAQVQPGDTIDIVLQSPRAGLPACPRPRASLPGGSQPPWGRVTVGLRCGDNTATAPVRYLQARVTVVGRYWVTAHALPADSPLDTSALEARRGDLGKLPRQVIRNPRQLQSQVTRRPLAKGTVVQQALLYTPPLIARRQVVSVVARGNGFRIALEGRALEAGVEGENIRVRMPDRQTLQATVTGPGRVAVAW